jgi:CTP synthase
VPLRPADPEGERAKLALFCNVREERVIEARDVDNIYAVPEAYHRAGPRRECSPPSGSSPRASPISLAGA